MSHEKQISERLSYRLPSLLPEYLRDEAPAFESFLKAYFEFLEAEILTLESQGELDGFAIEDGRGSLLFEPATVSPSPTSETSKVISETQLTLAGPYTVGEYIVGTTSKSVAKIEVVNGNSLFINTISGNGFSKGETVTGRNSKQKGIVSTYKENSVLANNKLLDYSDIDNTTEDFLEYFQKDFMPSIDLASLKNSRLTIKNIHDLYQMKGTGESLQFLMRLLYGQDATIRYPIDETIHVSESGYTQQRRMRLTMTSGIPEANDKITQYDSTGKIIIAQAVIENVYYDNVPNLYSLEIMNNHVGVFTKGSTVTILDRDGITTLTATVNGIISDITTGSSSYIAHNDSGVILLESGESAVYSGSYDGTQLNTESTNGGGTLYETKLNPFGALYNLTDQINIVGSKDDTDTTETKAVVNGLVEGGITEIMIESRGVNYEAGDIIVFEGGAGDGAEAVIGSIVDAILLETQTKPEGRDRIFVTEWEFTAIAGQTVFGGASVRDDYNNLVIFNDDSVRVFVDGIEKVRTTHFTTQNDRVTFESGLTVGQTVNVYLSFNSLTYEDDSPINHETATGEIRSVFIQSGGSYTTVPKAFPGGYIYLNDLSGYFLNGVVTGGTSGATATISRIETLQKRLVVKRSSTDTGVFQVGELIESGDTARACTQVNVSSGTGAKLFVWSDTAGGVASINIQDQGNKFDGNGILSSTSHFPMLITTPSATLTKDITFTGTMSGSTGKVVSYDADRHILTYRSLTGEFFENEPITYNISDGFTVLKSSIFDGRGLFAGEGIIEEQIVGDYGTTNAYASRIHDGKFYQSHSYVVKVGESINKWRGVVKDLLHPAGHIFFGEVAIKNLISTVADSQVRFLPTIMIPLTTDASIENAFSNSVKKVQIYTLSDEVEDPFVILREAGIPAVNTNPVDGSAISAYAVVGGIETGRGTEYYDSEMRSRKLNITVINSVASAITQSSPRLDSVMSVLNLRNIDNGWVVVEDERNRYGRPADQGKTFVSYTPSTEETLVYEDGTIILREPQPDYMRFEERVRRNVTVQGVSGERIISEDGIDLFNLETATTLEPVEHFVTERSIEVESGLFLEQDIGERLISEDGTAFIQEGVSETGLTSFVPFGSTLRTLNIISGQQTYDISYYIKDESDNDIALEDGEPKEISGSANPRYNSAGASFLMSEVSKPEGLRISDLDTYFPNLHLPEYELQARKRTNITFNAYIKSA